MKAIPPLPPYLNQVAEYAVTNMQKNGFKFSDCIYTSVSVRFYDRQVVFKQKVTKRGQKFMIDCWDIFSLSQTMLEDPLRDFSKFKVTVNFKHGEIGSVDYRIYLGKEETEYIEI